MKLSEILKNVDYKFLQGEDIEINNIEYDSRKVKQGSLFVCVCGFATNGCSYLTEALRNGAKAIMVEQPINLKDNITVVKVEDSRYAMAIASSNFYNNPSKKMKLIGVTGTNGKTSTTFLISYILESFGRNVGIIGTIENHIGNKIIKSNRTTPESLDLQCFFSEMLDQGIEDVVIEVSSHSLVLDRVSACDFDIGIFTNLTQEHMDFHRTMEDYREAKSKLFKMCRKGIINIDDEASKYIADVASCDIITFGIYNEADFKAENIKLNSNGVNFSVFIDNQYTEFFVPIPGKFSVYNSLGAIATCYNMGVSVNTIKEGLKNAKGVAGRCQSISSESGFTVIVDYAHTPDGLKNIITTVKEFAERRTIVVFGCGGDRDITKRSLMGEIAGQLSDFCVITSDNPRSENPETILYDIEEGILKTDCDYIKIIDRKEAIKEAMNMAIKGDIIIVAGKGHEDYQIFKDKTIHFNDIEIVKLFI